MKRCTVCKAEKEYSEYHNCARSKDGYGYRCRTCDREARRAYRDVNKKRFALMSRKKQLKFKYDLTLEDYDAILERQGGVCGICKCDRDHKNVRVNFAVDHCHITGKTRGLLCNQCNRGLGMLGDTTEAIETTLHYLKQTH